MPKILESGVEVKEKKTKKTTAKTGKAVTATKKAETKKKTEAKATTKKTVAKKSAEKDSITVKKEKTKKVTTKKTTTKKSAAKKPTTKKATKKAVKKEEKIEFIQEYYDLPYRYNETIVTVLAQTPKKLFVYWDISDSDREKFVKTFGNDFFDKTYPVLLVHNEELDYTFEVPINDFANSWYIDIQDSKKNYVVQLGRKFKNLEQAHNVNYDAVRAENINLENDYIHITDSNKLESPNDHILFEFLTSRIKYRNVKTGEEYFRSLRDLASELVNSYPAEGLQELYTKLYESEIEAEDFGRGNPASGELVQGLGALGRGLPTSSGAPRSSGQW